MFELFDFETRLVIRSRNVKRSILKNAQYQNLFTNVLPFSK